MEYWLLKAWSFCFGTSCCDIFLLNSFAYAHTFALVVVRVFTITIVTLLNMAGCVSSFYFFFYEDLLAVLATFGNHFWFVSF